MRRVPIILLCLLVIGRVSQIGATTEPPALSNRPPAAGIKLADPNTESPLAVPGEELGLTATEAQALFQQALALREARLQEQETESRVRQLQLALQLAEAEQALQQLQQDQVKTRVHPAAQPDLRQFRLRAWWGHAGQRSVQLSYGQQQWRVQDGDEVLPGIRVRLTDQQVLLQRGQEEVRLWSE